MSQGWRALALSRKTRLAFRPALKRLSREIKGVTNDRHGLALWETGVQDARTIAYLSNDPQQVTRQQMESLGAGLRLLGDLRRHLRTFFLQDGYCL